MRMTIALAAAAAAVLSAFAADELIPEPELRLGKMPKAPVIDGVIGDAEWEGAAQMQKVCIIHKKEAVPPGCVFWLGRDDDNIYVAMVSEANPKGVLKKHKNRGRSFVACFEDDCLEFDFIDDWNARRPTGTHYIVNFNGAYHVSGFVDGKALDRPELEDFKSAYSQKDGKCFFEFSVPLRHLRLTPGSGIVHAIRIVRNFKMIGNQYGHQCSWSPCDAAFGTAANSPKVVFDDDAPAVQMKELGEFSRGADRYSYPIVSTVANFTAKPLDLKIAYEAKPEFSQPCRFSEAFTLKPGESREFKSSGAVLNDEPIDFSFRVTSGDGSVKYYTRDLVFRCNRKPIAWKGFGEREKEVEFQYAYYPSANSIAAKVDVERAESLRLPAKFTLTLKTRKGETLAEKEFSLEDKVANVIWQVPDLRPLSAKSGESAYDLFLDVKGAKDGKAKGSFYRDVLAWENTDIGRSDTLPPPFEKVTREKSSVDGEEIVSVVQRRHVVDAKTALWRQVSSVGKNVLARPMAFRVGGSVVREAPGTAATAEWDIDGLCDWRLTLKPGRHEPLSLEIPILPERATLMHSCIDGCRQNYAGALPKGTGVVWNSTMQGGRSQLIGNYLPYLWIGGPLRGVAVFGDNDRGWVLDEAFKTPCVEIVREEGGVVVIRLNLVQRPVELAEARTIRIGFMATPLKPMPENWRAKDIGFLIGSGSCFGVAVDGALEPHDETDDFWLKMAEAKRLGKWDEAYLRDFSNRFPTWGHAERNDLGETETERWYRHCRFGMYQSAQVKKFPDRKFVFYTNPRGMEFGTKTGRTFADEWNRFEFLPNDRPDPLNREFHRCYCRDYDRDPVPSLEDYSVWCYKRMIVSGACSYLYWDCTYPCGNSSLPVCDAYRMPNGEIQPNCAMFAMRSLVKRCAVMQAELGVESGNNWVHMTNTAMAPLCSFAGVHYDWEDSADLQTFQDRYGRDYILACTIGRQFGNRVAIMGYISKTTPEKLAWIERTGVGVMLCHELLWSRVKQWNAAHGLLTDWGYRTPEVRVWNYWDEDEAYPLECSGEDCVSIAMSKPAAREAMIVVCDWAEGGTVSVRPDCAALCIPSGFSAVNVETGADVPVEGGVVKVALKKHDYAIIKLKAK